MPQNPDQSPSATPSPAPVFLRRRVRSIVGRELWLFLELFALTGFVVAQPLLDVLGHAPDFLLFRQASHPACSAPCTSA